MKLEVNGESRPWVANLDVLLGELGLAEAMVATAVNGEFVPVHRRAVLRLMDGDRVEVLAPMQGG